MYYIIIESTQLKQLLLKLKPEYKTQVQYGIRQSKFLPYINVAFFEPLVIDEASIEAETSLVNYKLPKKAFKKRLNYLQIYEVLTNIKQNTYVLFTKLYLSIHLFRLSFVLNAKYLNTITTTLEVSYKFYLQIPQPYCGTFIMHLTYLNLANLLLKNMNLLKVIKCFFKRPGNPYLRLRRIFPAINIAIGFKISKYVMLLMNQAVLLIPLILIS